MRSKHSTSDIFPTADQVARAIVAACRETGADPEIVASGRNLSGVSQSTILAISRARVYAAYALRNAVRGANLTVIARCCGVSKAVSGAYFSSKDQAGGTRMPWFDLMALGRVITAVVDPEWRLGSKIATSNEVEKMDMPDSSIPALKETKGLRPKWTILPDKRPDSSTPYNDDDGPVFDKGRIGGVKPRPAPERRTMSKAEMAADLAAALANSAKMAKPED